MSSKYLQEIPARPLADVPPPAYMHSTAPPPYVEQEEDSNDELFTVARLLFQYGFVCPLLWFVGAFVSILSFRWRIQTVIDLVLQILMLPLQPPTSWEETMTVEECNALRKMLHEAEVKWCRRCFAASLVFLVVLATIVITVILVTGH